MPKIMPQTAKREKATTIIVSYGYVHQKSFKDPQENGESEILIWFSEPLHSIWGSWE